jgi:catechol 2,3-dioxygenase-like lactoylglutathione lyase family enzyme
MRSLFALLLVCCCAVPRLVAEEAAFARQTIDVGMVVSDLEKAARFYTEPVGFKEVPGFELPGPVAADAGLTNGLGLKVRVFVLGEGPDATKLKLMQLADSAQRTGDNAFIHSHTGFRYLTIFVADMQGAVARLEKAGVKLVAKSPVNIPETTAPGGIKLTCFRDPDGNLIEFVGK